MSLQERQMMNGYEKIFPLSEQEVKQKINVLFPGQATIYAVLDYAVCFGKYEKNSFSVGLPDQVDKVELDWKYVQELRIFDKENEIYLVHFNGKWSGRIRRDDPDGDIGKESGEFVIDECQKLAGECRESGRSGWSVLYSGRGSVIKIPVDITGQPEYAVLIRRYMRIPDVERDLELVFQNDIRMVELCSWKKGDDGNDSD